jgi:hypothetical protein
MNQRYALPFALGLMLAMPAMAAPAKPRTAACPSEKFPAFFAAYADSVPLQKAFTDFPLTTTMLDYGAQPEPRQVSKSLPQTRLTFPLVPAKAVRSKQGLAFRTDAANDKTAKVTLFKEDTGYQVAYHFRKDACWKLERKEDLSM